MHNFPIGMKIYDNNWHLKHGFEPAAIADFMAEMGVNFVITQSSFLPMQDNAIINSLPSDNSPASQISTRNKNLHDLEFANELKQRDIKYFACMNVGFDAETARKKPHWLPLDQYGKPGEQIDWYVGIPPSNQAYIDQKAKLLTRAVEILQPDAVHLGFARWPGFWETWLPGMKRKDLREFCFAPITLSRFCTEKNIDLPINNPIQAAAIIAKKYRNEFTDFKCTITHKMIAQLKQATHTSAPDIPIAINTVPFSPDEFNNAIEEVLGQQHSTLGEIVDIFEVMAYHQILKRDVNWPGQISKQIKSIANQTTYCTLQTGTHYLEGMHAQAKRNSQVTVNELEQMIDSVLSNNIDGICFFTLEDFLSSSNSADMKTLVSSIRGIR